MLSLNESEWKYKPYIDGKYYWSTYMIKSGIQNTQINLKTQKKSSVFKMGKTSEQIPHHRKCAVDK